MHVYFHVHLRTCTVNLMYACTYTCIAWYCMNLMYIVHTCSLHQGLYIVFQMGWKHFVIERCEVFAITVMPGSLPGNA